MDKVHTFCVFVVSSSDIVMSSSLSRVINKRIQLFEILVTRSFLKMHPFGTFKRFYGFGKVHTIFEVDIVHTLYHIYINL